MEIKPTDSFLQYISGECVAGIKEANRKFYIAGDLGRYRSEIEHIVGEIKTASDLMLRMLESPASYNYTRRHDGELVMRPKCDIPQTTDADRFRMLLLKLGSGVQSMTQNYLLTVRQAPRALTDEDIESGNTREYQDGFVDALEVVAAEHIQPLVTIYNDVMKELNHGN